MPKYNRAKQKLIDLYVKCLSEDKIPWEKMWTTKPPVNAITGKNYKGINNLVLSYIVSERGYKDNRWCTFNQMKKKNWKFKSDAKGQGVYVEYWGKYNIKDKKTYSISQYQKIIKDNPELKDDFRTINKSTTVFNGDLIDGIPKQLDNEKDHDPIKTSEFINNIITNLGVTYIESGDRAYYNPTYDKVVIPLSETFKNEYSYQATQVHELSHSTGHPSRLNRNLSNHFGTQGYAKEELRAEISSSFLMQELSLEYDDNHIRNHKAYIQSWMELIEDKPSELFKAISDADKIVDYLKENGREKTKDLVQDLDYEEELEI